MIAKMVERIVLPPTVASVSAARRFVAGLVRRWGLDAVSADSALVVSELVTNAVEHGAGAVDLVVRRRPPGLRVEVTTDATDRLPERKQPSPTTEAGRGLQIVDALTERWGQCQADGRRTVWARLGASPMAG